jgi:hypothetical protein
LQRPGLRPAAEHDNVGRTNPDFQIDPRSS